MSSDELHDAQAMLTYLERERALLDAVDLLVNLRRGWGQASDDRSNAETVISLLRLIDVIVEKRDEYIRALRQAQ